MSPNKLKSLGVSPVLCIVWFYMLLFTGVMSVGLLVSWVSYAIIGFASYEFDIYIYGEWVTKLLVADIVFLMLVYLLFIFKGRQYVKRK